MNKVAACAFTSIETYTLRLVQNGVPIIYSISAKYVIDFKSLVRQVLQTCFRLCNRFHYMNAKSYELCIGIYFEQERTKTNKKALKESHSICLTGDEIFG